MLMKSLHNTNVINIVYDIKVKDKTEDILSKSSKSFIDKLLGMFKRDTKEADSVIYKNFI